MKFRYQNIFIFFAFLLICVLPYLIKLKNHHLELFPSIIMPSGHNKISVKDSISYSYKALFAIKNNKLERVNETLFLDGIPKRYLSYIINNDIGLSTKIKKATLIYNPKIVFHKNKKNHRKKTISYIKEKLKNQGFDTITITVKTIQVNYHIKTQNVSSTTLADDKVFKLY